MKPIIFFANAYDCIPSIEALKEIPCDQLHIEYYPYPQNYIEVEKFLNTHIEYTHIFYIAPDVVLTLAAWNHLMEYVEKNNPDVYGPCCNVDTNSHKDDLACCLKLPDIKYENRRYRWVKESHRQHYLNNNMPVIEVKFNANLCIIKREIKDKIPYMALPYLTDERPIHEKKGGFACDLAFNHFCESLNVKRLVDFRVKLQHLRYAGPLQVGKKEPKLTFIRYNE